MFNDPYRFFHYVFVDVVGNQLLLPLYVCKCQLADLIRFAIEGGEVPLDALELEEKVYDVDRMHKVNKGVSHIALGLKQLYRDTSLTFKSIGR